MLGKRRKNKETGKIGFFNQVGNWKAMEGGGGEGGGQKKREERGFTPWKGGGEKEVLPRPVNG